MFSSFKFSFNKNINYRLNIKDLGVLKISKKERTDVASALDWTIIFFFNNCMLITENSSLTKHVLHVKV